MRGPVIFCSLVLLFFSACSEGNEVPKKIIQPKDMERIVWDVMQADELALQERIADTTIQLKEESFRLYDQVFAIHNTTRAQYYSSYKYYQEHPDLYKALMEGVKKIGEKEKKGIYAPSH